MLCQLFRLVKMMTWHPYVKITGHRNKLSSLLVCFLDGNFRLQMAVPMNLLLYTFFFPKLEAVGRAMVSIAAGTRNIHSMHSLLHRSSGEMCRIHIFLLQNNDRFHGPNFAKCLQRYGQAQL